MHGVQPDGAHEGVMSGFHVVDGRTRSRGGCVQRGCAVLRSIEFPVDRAWVKNPNNSPLATMGARRGAAARTKLCITTIGLMLTEHLRTAPTRFVVDGAAVVPNRWRVRLTRISMGTLDPITGGASMKAVQDAVAQWCGVPNERDPVWSWVEPIGQEKRAKGFFGVRIEIEDLAPGADRRIVLSTIDGFVWLAKQRLKEAARMKIKRVGNVQSYQPEAVARGASSSARARAEAVFAKATGKPTALDLRDAAERALARPRASDGCHERPEIVMALDQIGRSPDPTPSLRRCEIDALNSSGSIPRRRTENRKPDRDPGEERPARELAACEVCGARTGAPCTRIGVERLVFGVHEARARAAGLQVPDDDRASVRPRIKCDRAAFVSRADLARNPRKLATVPGQARLVARRVFIAPPWEPGKLVAERSLEGMQVPRDALDLRVPLAHVARWGAAVKLYRREVTLPAHGVCWVYVARSGPEGT